jgi:hypothetical protein
MFGAPSAKSRPMRESQPLVIVSSGEDATPVRLRFTPASDWPARSLGAAATVLVHMLISAPLVLGYDAHKPRERPDQGAGSVAWASRGEQSEAMILLDLSALTQLSKADSPSPQIDAEGITPDEMELQLVSVDPSPPPELESEEIDESEVANEASGDPAGNAALYGRYMSHITARIERAWTRPRSPVGGGHFDCRARIAQDRAGAVLDVQLQDCSEDVAWRISLEAAIRRAAPLSSPPEPWLFTPTISLTFAAEQYVAGRTPDHRYEAAPRRVAMQDSGSSQTAPASPHGESGDYELTNDGDRIVWKKKSAASRQ